MLNAIESTALVVAVTIAFFAWNRLPVVVVAIRGGAVALGARRRHAGTGDGRFGAAR